MVLSKRRWLAGGLVSCLFLLSLFLSDEFVQAQMIITDQRARDTTVTPVLGRGFSLATNTYQSVCLSDVVHTEPSFDFDYKLEEISEESLNQGHEQTSSISSRYSFVRSMMVPPGSRETSVKRTRKWLGMSLTVSTYHAAVDESSTPLSEYATQLLGRLDTPGFFAACGTYYVRGISRQAEFSAVFEYEEQESTSKQSVKKAISDLVFAVRNKNKLTSANKVSMEVLRSSKLLIFSQGRGLGYGERNQLISFDMDGFRKALRAAFGLMQRTGTGRVTGVEVVPWTENLSVQNLLDLREETDSPAASMPLFRKKEILTYNAEYLANLHRSLQKRKARYYLARDCANHLNAYRFPDWAILKNHVNQGVGIPVGKMREILQKDKIDNLLRKKAYFSFLVNYERCVEKILTGPSGALEKLEGSLVARMRRADINSNAVGGQLEQGKALYLFRYTSYPECTSIELTPPAFEGFARIQESCLPVLWGNADELPRAFLQEPIYQEALDNQLSQRLQLVKVD